MPRPTLVSSLAASLWAVLVLAPVSARAEGESEIRRTRIVTAVERARPAVVAIHTTEIVTRNPWMYADLSEIFGDLPPISREREGLGSGVIFHGDGYVVTNAHVIIRASKILVDVVRKDPATGEERTVQVGGRVLAVDVPNDLALLKLETTNAPSFTGPFPHLPLGRSNDLMLGEEVIAVGHPYGLGFTVTTGVLSGTGRRLPSDRRGLSKSDEVRDFLQIDAAINQGNSGGPLMDVTGRWIGVTSAILNRRDTGAEGIGFAIPSDRVRALILRAMKRRLLTEEWIGLEEEEGKNGEAVVRVVYPKGPAAGANLKPGDVITALDGRAIRSLYDYRMAMASLPTRSRVTLSLARGGTALPDPVVLAMEAVPTETLSAKHLGLQVVSVDEEINRQTQIPFDSGVIVREVRADGPGARIQLKPGDVIVGLGTWKIRNADDLLIFLQYVQPGDLVKVKIRRVVQRFADERLRWEDKEGALVAE